MAWRKPANFAVPWHSPSPGGTRLAACAIDEPSFNGDVKMSEILLLAESSGSGVFVFGGTLFVVLMLIVLAASIFWIWMLIDVLTSNMPVAEKLLWFLVIFFLHLVGTIIYFVMRRSGRAAPSM
jgi:hypothetical protein